MIWEEAKIRFYGQTHVEQTTRSNTLVPRKAWLRVNFARKYNHNSF